jgi:hypothetical protein
MNSEKTTTLHRVEELGTKIIECHKNCEGMAIDRSNGEYPQSFFLEPPDISEVGIAIIGLNPGHARPMEKEFYRFAAEVRGNKTATYKDCVRAWHALSSPTSNYYERPRLFLEGLGLANEGKLWAEIAFCENGRDKKAGSKKNAQANKPFEAALKRCSAQYLKRILEMISNEKYILCLGKQSFKMVRGKVESDTGLKNKGLIIIGTYHPTGIMSGRFLRYFEDFKKFKKRREEKGTKVKPKLKDKITQKFNDYKRDKTVAFFD